MTENKIDNKIKKKTRTEYYYIIYNVTIYMNEQGNLPHQHQKKNSMSMFLDHKTGAKQNKTKKTSSHIMNSNQTRLLLFNFIVLVVIIIELLLCSFFSHN